MPLARERSRIEAPSYPFLQKTSVAWVRISANRRSKRVAGTGTARSRRVETRAAVDGLPIRPARLGADSNVRSKLSIRECRLDHKPGIFPELNPAFCPSRPPRRHAAANRKHLRNRCWWLVQNETSAPSASPSQPRGDHAATL